MLIASKIKRPKAPIHLPNGPDKPQTAYYFTPVDPNNPYSEHICEIKNPAHIQRLLAITEGYHISSHDPSMAEPPPETDLTKKPSAATSTPAKPATTEPSDEALDKNPSDDEGGDAPTADTNTGGDALEGNEKPGEELLELPLAKFKEAIKTAPKDQVSAALAKELSRTEAEQRPTFVKAMNARLAA